ncbi:MAG: signal peptide peptidase SppA [Planctomycetota bacterium]
MKIHAILLTCLLLQPALLAGNGDDDSKTVQIVTIGGSYADHPSGSGFDPMSLLTGQGASKSFFDLCERLSEIARDPKVDAVLLDLSSPSLGLNQAQFTELGRHIGLLRAAGKPTYAWLEGAGTPHYAVASACDTIVMADFGALDLPSLSMTSMHFRDAMDLLGIRADVVRVGEFKGAVEPFTLSHMSQHLREHYLAMVTSMNDALVSLIAENRGLEAKAVRDAQARRLIGPLDAKKRGLVDVLVPYGEDRARIGKMIGDAVVWKDPSKEKKSQSLFDILRELMDEGSSGPKGAHLAVLHLDGSIVDGTQAQSGSMVSGPTVEAILDVANDRDVRGVVVRIDSPGGSATASEAIREALEELASRKPVVFSMGNVAASGGYWITCIGRPIFAEAGTITGSIGVFGMKMNLGPLLNRIGIHIETIALDETAAATAPDRGFGEELRASLEEHIGHTYDRFLGLVARSRRMSVDKVDSIGGGRVWSGAQARELGLVDHVGGLDDALAALREQVGVKPDIDVAHLPKAKSFFESLSAFSGASVESPLAGIDPAVLAWAHRLGFRLEGPLQLLLHPASPSTVWALTPTELVIR